jgi:hypothetical protein
MTESSEKSPLMGMLRKGMRRTNDTGNRSLMPGTERVTQRPSESGQALAETAIFSLMAVLLAFSLLALIPQHRARTVATSAAYSCAQFVSQSPNPTWAVYQARTIARRTLDADWSGTLGVQYDVEVLAPNGPGSAAGCAVFYHAPVLFNGLLGASDPGWSVEWFLTQSETWKARWR